MSESWCGDAALGLEAGGSLSSTIPGLYKEFEASQMDTVRPSSLYPHFSSPVPYILTRHRESLFHPVASQDARVTRYYQAWDLTMKKAKSQGCVGYRQQCVLSVLKLKGALGVLLEAHGEGHPGCCLLGVA